MRIYPLCNPKPWTDLSRILGKNSLKNGFVKLVYKFVQSVTKTSSKVREPKTYNETIHDLIHGNRCCKIIDEELRNLDTYQTWCYISLPDNKKAISYKWVFKIKYNFNGSIERYKARLVRQNIFQVYGIDYTEIFASLIRCKSPKIFLAIAIILRIILI